MNYKDLADLIFPNAKEISYYEEKYPNRNLKEGAVVTRYAPSPTGVMHIGGLYQALIAKKLSKQTDGVFFLRIEDTDQERYVEGAVDIIFSILVGIFTSVPSLSVTILSVWELHPDSTNIDNVIINANIFFISTSYNLLLLL